MFRLTVVLSIVCITIIASVVAEEDPDLDRIVGGRTSSISEVPYLVSLQNNKIHYCGGSLISKNFVLSAAHCIKGVIKAKLCDLTARVGATLWNSGGQIKGIIGMIAHPNYNTKTKAYDCGLYKLASPVLFNSGVQVIKMATGVPRDGKIGIIAGWGMKDEAGYFMPNMVQVAEVESISKANCSQPPWDYGDDIKASMICARGNGIDACQGDSGGPYVSKQSNELWGITSFGKGCARPNYPGVYCAVAAIRKWVLETMDCF